MNEKITVKRTSVETVNILDFVVNQLTVDNLSTTIELVTCITTATSNKFNTVRLNFDFKFLTNLNEFRELVVLQFYSNTLKTVRNNIFNVEKQIFSLEERQKRVDSEQESDLWTEISTKISVQSAKLENLQNWQREVCDIIAYTATYQGEEIYPLERKFNRDCIKATVEWTEKWVKNDSPLLVQIKVAEYTSPDFFPEVKGANKALIALQEFYEAMYQGRSQKVCNAHYKHAREALQTVCEELHIKTTSYSEEWNVYASAHFTKVTAYNIIASYYQGLRGNRKTGREERKFSLQAVKRQLLLELIQPLYSIQEEVKVK